MKRIALALAALCLIANGAHAFEAKALAVPQLDKQSVAVEDQRIEKKAVSVAVEPAAAEPIHQLKIDWSNVPAHLRPLVLWAFLVSHGSITRL